ncbi:AMP dependent ligase, putative [Ricinus communis]|uniref:AMP dependent ligase, putative n=1 Tax=Ricinus communis TaxID=3988 RepID=B9SJL3_RICCO|nr:AMP dependent ligase, putative [Ricinus communis]
MDRLPKCEANYVPLTPLTFWKRAAAVYANRTSVIYERIRFTWGQTSDRCCRLASSLRSLNIMKNDVVSVLAPNVPAMYEMHFAVPMTGAILNTINTRLDAKTIATILRHSEAKVFFVDYEYVPLAREALRLLMDLVSSEASFPLVIVIDDIDSPTGIRLGELEYEHLIHRGNPNYVPEDIQDEWAPIALNYTSGTTSEPKGVVYSHRGAYLSTLSLILGWEMGNEPVYLWSLPMFHCNDNNNKSKNSRNLPSRKNGKSSDQVAQVNKEIEGYVAHPHEHVLAMSRL